MLSLATILVWAAWAATSSSAAPAATTPRPLHVVAETATYNADTGTVDFVIRFDRPPNFRLVDEFGRRADSFQYFVSGDATLPDPQNLDSIIRGDELDVKQRLLPIRAAWPPDPAPAAGGWGAVRLIVPVRLRGSELAFSAPLAAVSDHSTDGTFTYTLETYNFGATVDSIVNTTQTASAAAHVSGG